MRIAVIGAGAMGSIYAGRLSKNNEVILIDLKEDVIDKINEAGIKIDENGATNTYYPKAYVKSDGLDPVDLIIVFVKSMFSESALKENENLISEDTYLMTLQNGAGHQEILKKFVSEDKVIIGTTEDNGAVIGLGHVKRGGVGNTNIGLINKDSDESFLEKIKESFVSCGFNLNIEENINQLIWNKIITNASLSVLTGILQVPIGFIASNENSWTLCKNLINEVLETGRAQGLSFDTDKEVEKVRLTSVNNPDGLTSIYADIKEGRKSEVDTISGAIVKAGKEFGVNTPYSEFAVNAVHALESK